MAINTKKRSRVKVPNLKGHGNGKISYKAKTSCQKLGTFFSECKEEEESSD